MADQPVSHPSGEPATARSPEYVVVARRYRPQTFEELLGQEHVARALSNAISTNRVGHAYLFTGARGVGKTSAARILAKALNCEHGPAPVPCNRCDICESISSGDDVDVLEIDGASNRGIDEIRQLRQNVNVRPSRERFKIYIIDEVHMLTREAFNALLKTLEEPPEHVKFIFCTTEPGKIPITILSRCQRFDFAGIRAVSIAERLRQIVEAEGVTAEPEALEVIARRANGSMRDSQSLLEQLLAFASERITVGDVNGMLGTAGEERLATLVNHLVQRDAAATLADLDGALQQGVEVAQLIEQLFGYFRDCLVAAAGCPGDMFLSASPSNWPMIVDAGKRMGLETILAAMQILDHTLARLRYSTQGRILAELALVRISNLEDLADLPSLIAQIQGAIPLQTTAGTPGQARTVASAPAAASQEADPAKKKERELPPPDLVKPVAVARETSAESPGTPQIPPPADQSPQPPAGFSTENPTELWSQAVSQFQGFAAEHAKHFAHAAISAPNRLVISFREAYTFSRSICERPDQKTKFEQILSELTGRRVQVEFRLLEEEKSVVQATEAPSRAAAMQQRGAQVASHPMVRRAADLFHAHPVRVDEPSESRAE
jgi:DNA polymerase-3 subunit gamma/tau